jgi:hypothetical protein
MAKERITEVDQDLDWDCGIASDVHTGPVETPPVGDYNFTVTNFEKTISKSGKKMAKLTLALDVSGQVYLRDVYLVLTSSALWKLAQFLECVGLKKKGVDLPQIPWGKVLGSEGRCRLIHEEYNGSQVGRVDQFLEKKPTVASKAKAASIDDDDMPFEL